MRACLKSDPEKDCLSRPCQRRFGPFTTTLPDLPSCGSHDPCDDGADGAPPDVAVPARFHPPGNDLPARLHCPLARCGIPSILRDEPGEGLDDRTPWLLGARGPVADVAVDRRDAAQVPGSQAGERSLGTRPATGSWCVSSCWLLMVATMATVDWFALPLATGLGAGGPAHHMATMSL